MRRIRKRQTCHKRFAALLLVLIMAAGIFPSDVIYAAEVSGAVEAVVPKSLAFNGVVSKMAVGETQQLDVRIVKAQTNDTVLLGYASDNAAVEVSESGYVTARAKGSANIEVYPCCMENGKKIPTGDAKVRKKVKITVSDVAVPKISKVVPGDTYADIRYIKPNGYQREIYVLEGKRTEADFKQAISKVEKDDYSAFIYTGTAADEVTDQKGMVLNRRINGLAPNTEYTVYVRNVSGVRTPNGYEQIGVSASGAVKAFKTINPQAVQINAYFDQSVSNQTAKGCNYNAEQEEYEYYEAKLADQFAKLSVKVKFHEGSSKDHWNTFPLASDIKKAYTEPKMTYYVSDREYNNNNLTGSRICVNGHYYDKLSDVVSVDKNGKVTFKGKSYSKHNLSDCVYVAAVDINTGIGDVEKLVIQSAPDGITGKPMKLQTGQSAYLSEYIEYKEDKVKIANYQRRCADLQVSQETNEYFRIQKTDDGDYLITALKEGGRLELEVTDTAVAAKGGSAAAVKLTSSVMEPVKKLKAQDVYDNKFTVAFSYPVNPADRLGTDYAAAAISPHDFQFELRDAGGNVVTSQTETMTGIYDSKTKKMIYHKTFSGSGIRLLSKYKLNVWAVCENTSTNEVKYSKEAKLAIKTTNIPASYNALTSRDKDTGSEVMISVDGAADTATALKSKPVLKTGNTYRLNLELTGENDNPEAKTKMTDTLTWTVKNRKIATVKADKGGYSATLKTQRQGETDIEVKSKITKKVIARWSLKVSAVGSKDGYFDDNKQDTDSIEDKTVDWKDALEVVLDNPVNVTLDFGKAQWFVFTAPAYGNYVIKTDSEDTVYYSDLEGMQDTIEEKRIGTGNRYDAGILEKDTKIYVYIQNITDAPVSVKVKAEAAQSNPDNPDNPEKEVVLGEGIKAYGDAWIVFTAPEDYNYTFIIIDGETKYELGEYFLTKGESKKLQVQYEGKLSAAKEYIVKVEKTEKTKPAEVGSLSVGGDAAEIMFAPNEEKWYSFKAEEYNYYSFYFTELTGTVNAAWYHSQDAQTPIENRVGTSDFALTEMQMEKDDTVYLKLSSGDATAEVSSSVKLVIRKRMQEDIPLTVDGETEIVLQPNVPKWYSLDITEHDYYTIYFLGLTKQIKAEYYNALLDREPFGYDSGISDFHSDELECAAGKTLYVKLTLDDSTADSFVNFKVKVKKREEIEQPEKFLTIDSNGTHVELGENKEQWLMYTATQENLYTFYTTDATAAITLEYYEAPETDCETFVNSEDANDVSLDIPVEFGEAETKRVIYLRMYSADATGENPVKATLSVKKREVEQEALQYCDTGVEIALGKEDKKWYAFTAPESNCYVFYSENATQALTSSCYRRLSDTIPVESHAMEGNPAKTWTDTKVRECEVSVKAGDTVYVKISPDNSDEQDNGLDADVTATIKVQKREIDQSLTLGEEPVSLSFACDWSTHWYQITAEESNLYHFTFEKISGVLDNFIQYGVYENLEDRAVLPDHWGYIYGFEMNSELNSIPIQKGKSVYLRAYLPNSNLEVKVTVEKQRVFEKQKLTLEENGIVVTLEPGETKYYLFDAEESSVYRFYSTEATAGVTATYYDSLTTSDAVGTFAGTTDEPNFDTGYQSIRAGNQVCLGLHATDDAAQEPVTLRLKAQKYNVTELSLGDTGEMVSSADSMDDKWFRFTAQEEGHYCFSSKSSSSSISQYMWLSDNLAPESDKDAVASDNGNGDLACRVQLSQNQIVYVRLRFGSPDQAAVLRVNKIDEIGESGSAVIALDASGSKEVCYQLPKDGSYTIQFKRNQNQGSISAEMWLNKAASKTTKVIFYPQTSYTYSNRRAGEILHIVLEETGGVSGSEVTISIVLEENTATNEISNTEGTNTEENSDIENSDEESSDEGSSDKEISNEETSYADDDALSEETGVEGFPVSETGSADDNVPMEEAADRDETVSAPEE